MNNAIKLKKSAYLRLRLCIDLFIYTSKGLLEQL